jgi:hypothetical protein
VRAADLYLLALLIYSAVATAFVYVFSCLQFAIRYLFSLLFLIFADIFIAIPVEAIFAGSTVLVAA